MTFDNKPEVGEAVAVLKAMQVSQPGLHTDTLVKGFAALLDDAIRGLIDRKIVLSDVAGSSGLLRVKIDPNTTLNSDAWCELLGVQIMDPDGWDRKNMSESWSECITRDEFIRRVRISTIKSLPGSPIL